MSECCTTGFYMAKFNKIFYPVFPLPTFGHSTVFIGPRSPGPIYVSGLKLSIGFFLSFDNIDKKEKNLVKIDLSDKIR